MPRRPRFAPLAALQTAATSAAHPAHVARLIAAGERWAEAWRRLAMEQ